MTKTVILLAAALLFAAGPAIGQSTGTDKELNRLINETNALLGESRDFNEDNLDEWLSLIRVVEAVGPEAPRAQRKARTLRRTLRPQITRFGEIATRCGVIRRKIETTSWPPLSGDPQKRGTFAQRARQSARNCVENAREFAESNRELLNTLAEAGL